MKKNIALIVLTLLTIISTTGWGISAREAHSNAVVMHSEAKIIREHVTNQHNGNENNN